MERALQSIKRALYSMKWALRCIKWALYSIKRALYSVQRPTFYQMSQTFFQTNPIFYQYSPIFHSTSPIRHTQSMLYVPLQVIRRHKSILLIVQYKYLQSCSENFILKNLVLRTRSCGTAFITQHCWLLHFRQAEIFLVEIICTTAVPASKGHLGGASP